MENAGPKHYIKISVSRELTNLEFEDMTDIIEDEIGDIVISDDVLEFEDDDSFFCYVFQLGTDIANCEQGPSAEDLIAYEIEQILPTKLQWNIEVSKHA